VPNREARLSESIGFAQRREMKRWVPRKGRRGPAYRGKRRVTSDQSAVITRSRAEWGKKGAGGYKVPFSDDRLPYVSSPRVEIQGTARSLSKGGTGNSEGRPCLGKFRGEKDHRIGGGESPISALRPHMGGKLQGRKKKMNEIDSRRLHFNTKEV